MNYRPKKSSLLTFLQAYLFHTDLALCVCSQRGMTMCLRWD